MLPRVILHNAVSLDGRIDGFPVDLQQYYALAAAWKEDATLAGSGTFLKAASVAPPEDESAFVPPKVDPSDHRAILVIPDSRGRIRTWHYLRSLPYWRHFVALCSKSTPRDYLDYLKERHIDCIIAGEDHVDLRTALGGAVLSIFCKGGAGGCGRHIERPAPPSGAGERGERAHLSQPCRGRDDKQHLSVPRPAGCG